MVRNLDAYCPRSHYPSHNTFLKVQIQGSNNKYSPGSKKPKNKDLKSAPLYGNTTEPAKKKNKKKRLQGRRQEWN